MRMRNITSMNMIMIMIIIVIIMCMNMNMLTCAHASINDQYVADEMEPKYSLTHTNTHGRMDV